MEILLDMHIHTISSGHAYSTIQEIAQEASRKNLKYIGITDHGPEMKGGPNIFHFGNMKVLPDSLYGVRLLKGVEANILDREGNLDIPERLLESLDLVIASLHDVCIEPSTRDENTEALLNVMDNRQVNILGHIGNPAFPIHKEEVVLKAKKTKTLIEINNSSFVSSRLGSYDNCKEIAKLCKKHKQPIIINSDSHFSSSVGEFKEALAMLDSIDMPRELIVNYDEELFLDYMDKLDK